MKHPIQLLVLGALLAAPGLLQAKITRVVDKTFAVQPGGRLQASTQGGDIRIATGDAAEVQIHVKQVIQASTEAEADEILTKLELTLEQSGNNVTAEAKYAKGEHFRWFKSWPPVSVSFEITVPKNYNLQLNTSGGNIAVASLQGDVKARTSGGDLDFARIDGEIEANTSGGNITLQEGTARARLGTSGGDIKVERAGGPTEVNTSGGNITLRSVAQLISAHTSGGDIRAVITERLQADAVLNTSGGDVDVVVVKDAGFELDASTSGGDVRANGLTITLEQGGSGKSKLRGSVNGGGPRLKLRSSGGDIKIRTN
jgi:hypothetical protein